MGGESCHEWKAGEFFCSDCLSRGGRYRGDEEFQ